MANSRQDNTFANWLAQYGKGQLDDELSMALKDVVAAVMLLDQKGSVTLTINLSKQADGLGIEPVVKFVAPRAKNNLFYYVGKDGLPTRRNEAQPSITDTTGREVAQFQSNDD